MQIANVWFFNGNRINAIPSHFRSKNTIVFIYTDTTVYFLLETQQNTKEHIAMRKQNVYYGNGVW